MLKYCILETTWIFQRLACSQRVFASASLSPQMTIIDHPTELTKLEMQKNDQRFARCTWNDRELRKSGCWRHSFLKNRKYIKYQSAFPRIKWTKCLSTFPVLLDPTFTSLCSQTKDSRSQHGYPAKTRSVHSCLVPDPQWRVCLCLWWMCCERNFLSISCIYPVYSFKPDRNFQAVEGTNGTDWPLVVSCCLYL